MGVDGVFVAGACTVAFGIILIVMGLMLPDFMPVLWPVAVTFIACGIALKVISVTHAK
ncbi:MAG: hypothetical protein KatS3mg003_2351 [Candidatus Nitrosocaldaceae archaeon]|jgi:membrane-bound ClpP family serine protease|nr:MAG: hypothetical protein KatS3mg003_0946 [Candidatus Nitrosocaldaceae archaeon]GIU72219.1 MAG: hypothetical protein KatS3mg003_1698 [Candidatus Nitrosocaldaceae archaeon]GIU72872.1 MAG: hypothetical protein KatS3mg003_2351 [Candidatus Nitrosocaldaceae archaeon]